MPVIATRYARALADLTVTGAAKAEALRQELRDLTATLAESPTLRGVLASPAVSWSKKRAVLEAIAKRSGVSALARNFLMVAAERGRLNHLAEIDAAFEEILLERSGMVRTQVVSARALEAGEKAEIERQLSQLTGRKLQTEYRQDEALMGGFTARIGDKVYDGSIRGRLQRLRSALVAQ